MNEKNKQICQNFFYDSDYQNFDVGKIEPEKKNMKKKYKPKKTIPKIALSSEDRTKLLDYVELKADNLKHYLIIKTMIEGGLRAQELANLLVENCKFSNAELGIIEIPDTKENREKGYKPWKPKTRQNRIVSISTELAKELRRFLKLDNGKTRTSGYVFLSQKKGRYRNSSISHIWEKYSNDALGFQVGSHTARRTCATYLSGVNGIGKAQVQLGHNSAKTTIIYMKNIQNRENLVENRKALDNMNKRPKKTKK